MCHMALQAALQQQAQDTKKKVPAIPRAAGGEKWWDSTLMEWPENDFRCALASQTLDRCSYLAMLHQGPHFCPFCHISIAEPSWPTACSVKSMALLRSPRTSQYAARSIVHDWNSVACRIFVGDLGNEVNDDVLQKSFQKFTTFVKGKVVRDKRTNKTEGDYQSDSSLQRTHCRLCLCRVYTVDILPVCSAREKAHFEHTIFCVRKGSNVCMVTLGMLLSCDRLHDAGYGFVSFTDPIEGAKALREMDGKYIGNRPCKLRKSTWDERIDQQQVNKKKRKHNPDWKPILNHKKHVGVLHR